jgi:hypothetical protein
MRVNTFTIATAAVPFSNRRPAIAVCTVLTVILNAHQYRWAINAVNFGDPKMSQPDSKSDLAVKPVPFFLLWAAPILILLSLNFVRLPLMWVTVTMSASFAWMGIGCAINAYRCHRRHCYYASPILIVGAVLAALVGFAIIDLGAYGLMYVAWGTFAAVLLTFLPERLSGKYKT